MNLRTMSPVRLRIAQLKKLACKPAPVFLVFFFASSLRFLYYGFKYFPQLDDYIQYHNLATSNDYAALIRSFGLLASRPLSSVSDIFIWSHFWGCMIIAVLIISALWTASALLFRSVLSNYFKCGYFFVAFYLLLPLNFEGTYWMSASTRIVCGMFFCSLSLFLFEKWLSIENEKRFSTKKVVFLLFWLLCQLVAFCYYEQVLALTGFLTLFLMLLRLRKGDKSALFALLTFANLAIYFIFTGSNSGGNLSARINLILPWQEGYFTSFLPTLLHQIGAAFLKGGSLTLFKGFYRGVLISVSDGAWLYALLVIIAAFVIFAISRTEKPGRGEYKAGFAVIAALLLILAPLSPYFIISSPWFSLRAVVTSFVGASLLFDTLLTLLLKNRTAAASVITAVFVFAAGIASVSELHDYKATYDYDTVAIEIIAEKTAGTGLHTGILNLNATYLGDQNYYYHEHIHGVTESDWALQGALYANYHGMPEVVPLATDGFSYYEGWNRHIKLLGGYEALYWWNPDTLELTKLRAEGSDEQGWRLYDGDELVARVWEETPYGYIEIY